MGTRLATHLREAAARQVPLWVDAWAYGTRVLRKGKAAPWEDLGELVAFHRQLQGLVRSDIVTINAADFYRHWLDSHPALLTAMAEKRRLGYALRTLLADDAARKQMREVVGALYDCYPEQPVALALPSPRAWMATAHGRAHALDDIPVSWDDAESAAMYMADFLRNFSDCGLSGLLLVDAPADGPACDADLERYRPVINVVEHYRWQLALLGTASGFCPATENTAIYTIDELSTKPAGATLDQRFWSTGELPGETRPLFWYAEVPEDAVPELVLERLETLRKKAI